ncbi:MAG: hypothetical protein AB7L66_15600 [Gemmatimonadales bacterium]
MTWFEKHFGLDPIDVAIQVAVTGIGMAIADEFLGRLFGRMVADVVMLKLVGLSVIVFAWRRHRALKRRRAEPAGLTSGEMAAERLALMEDRLAELEAAQGRVEELEARLEFTERLLTKGEERVISGKGGL